MNRPRRAATRPPVATLAAAALAFGGAITATTLTGCGAGVGSTLAQPAISGPTLQATGRAVFTMIWPQRTPANGRLIPFAAESIDIRLTTPDGKKLLGESLLVRPAGGGEVSASFDKVPVGAVTLTANAYPNADGSGVALASALSAVTVIQNQNTPVSLTMASTIKKLVVTSPTSTLTIGQSTKLIATATDASGAIVLVGPTTLTWASSVPGVATVDVSGKLTGVALGASIITATESESGVSGASAVTVAVAPTPTPSPTPIPTPTPTPVPTPTPKPATTISFANPVSYSAPNAADLIAADLDGDGNADVAVLSAGNIVVFWGNGDGTFGSGQTVYTGSGDNPDPRVAADMNNDGKLDIVCSAINSSTVYVLLNTGSRTFTNVMIPVAGGTKTSDLAVADFDGDGKKDIAAMLERSSGGGGGSIVILKNNGSGSFSAGASYGVGDYAEGIVAGDINGDSKPDMIGTYISGSGGSKVFLGKGDGTFTVGNSYNTASANIPIPILADFNNDGKVDLGVDDYFDNNMGVLFGNGDGTFQAANTYSDAPYPLVWQAVDLDGDGYLDIVTPNAGTGNFTVLRNLGTGFFGSGTQFGSGGSNTRTSATADFNRDGRPDLVFGCESSNSIQVLINTSK